MKKVYNLLVLILLLLTNDIYAGIIKPDTLAAENLKPYGRYHYNSKRNLELISSAAHFGVQFKGTRCEIYASMPDKDAHGYLQYELDGVYQKRLRIDGDSPRPIIITAPKFGNHKIWIYKCTEATTGAIQISKIAAEHVTPLKVAEAPLIEFIGNSIIWAQRPMAAIRPATPVTTLIIIMPTWHMARAFHEPWVSIKY